jgi:hypothetical protein
MFLVKTTRWYYVCLHLVLHDKVIARYADIKWIPSHTSVFRVTEHGVWLHQIIMYLTRFDCGSKYMIRSIPDPVPPNILDTQKTMINDIY